MGVVIAGQVSNNFGEGDPVEKYKIANADKLKAEADKLRAEKESVKQNRDFWNDALK